MKKTSLLISLGLSALLMPMPSLASGIDQRPWMAEIFALADIPPPYKVLRKESGGTTLLTLTYEVPTNAPPERIAKALATFIRGQLPALTDKKEGVNAYNKISLAMNMLKTYHVADSLALLDECILSANDDVRSMAIDAYVIIVGLDTAPLFREIFEKYKSLTGIGIRERLYKDLESATVKLKAENKTNDVAKLNAFVKEMKQKEQPQK